MLLLSRRAITLALFAPLCLPAFAGDKARLTADASPSQLVQFNVTLPLAHRDQLETVLHGLHDQGSASYSKWLSPDSFRQQFGAAPASLAAITQQLTQMGLTVTQTGGNRLRVTGTAAAVNQALGTTLKTGSFRSGAPALAATGGMHAPSSLVAAGAVVSGLASMVHMQVQSKIVPQNRYSTAGPYWFTDLKQAYRNPSYKSLNGKGTTIAVLMDCSFQQSDMDAYFGHEGLDSPKIKEIKVDGGAPFNPASAGCGEAALDIQQAAGMSPRSKILLYNIPNLLDESIYDGLAQIVADNQADVVNMSFSGPELFYTAEYNDGVDFTGNLQVFDDLFAQGNAQGITFVGSSGDAGGVPAPPLACFTNTTSAPCGDFLPSVEFPASSPHVTGVGGTNLATTFSPPNLDSKYVYEQAIANPLLYDIYYGTTGTNVFWGSGGGDSIYFKKPAYQYLVNTGNPRFRTVPDVSLHMGGCVVGSASCDPDDSADVEVIGGQYAIVIGTSASAPDFAGLTALAVERYGRRMGNENYYIYTLAAAQSLVPGLQVFHTGIPGNNGYFQTTPRGYNRVLGNGTVQGNNFLLNLGGVAGTPQTPSNP